MGVEGGGTAEPLKRFVRLGFIAGQALPTHQAQILAHFVRRPWVLRVDFGGGLELVQQRLIDFRGLGGGVQQGSLPIALHRERGNPDGESQGGNGDKPSGPPGRRHPKIVGPETQGGREDPCEDYRRDRNTWNVQVEFDDTMDQESGQPEDGAQEKGGAITGFESEVAAAFGEFRSFDRSPNHEPNADGDN